ncbi:MAG: BCCT family transporter [Mycobacterium kyogaense]
MFYWAWWVSWTPFVGMFIAANLPRPHHPSVRGGRAGGAERGVTGPGFAIFGGRGNQRCSRTEPTSPARVASRSSCSRCSTSIRSRSSPASS